MLQFILLGIKAMFASILKSYMIDIYFSPTKCEKPIFDNLIS